MGHVSGSDAGLSRALIRPKLSKKQLQLFDPNDLVPEYYFERVINVDSDAGVWSTGACFFSASCGGDP